MNYRILTEASGSLTASYLIRAIQQANAVAVASDVNENCAGKYIGNEFVIVPFASDPFLWDKTKRILVESNINVVIPSLDETLLNWAEKKEEFENMNIKVILSNKEVIKIFQDKWLTYQFFKEKGIPTPQTSTDNIYPVIKPREGRGGKDIIINSKEKVSMQGMISQELVSGQEYTIDVFCDKNSIPIYIIPRKRLQVKDGKSINGITEKNETIINWVKKICKETNFIGPINIQCFQENNGLVKFIEVNPRIAGGMALGFAASENWIKLIIEHFIEDKTIETKEVKYGLKMFRFYDEVFIS
jgi:carbamoyl-phosphate synthase large subunit